MVELLTLVRKKTFSLVTFLIVSTFLVISMLAGIAFAAATALPDISNHWAGAEIAKWAERGLVKGYPDGTFKPDGNVSRAEFMALVNRAFGYSQKAPVNYKDVPEGAWFYGTVAEARAAGYISGYEDGTMRPENPILRAEAAAIIARVTGLAADAGAAAGFADAADIPSWSAGVIGAAAKAGIMGGYPDGSFRAQDFITRAEAVVALSRALSTAQTMTVTYDKAGVYGPAEGTAAIKGGAVIKAAGVTLQNTVIEGDLTIHEAVGEGDVTLKNVAVRGTAYINGGGAGSVHLIDAVLKKAVVLKTGGAVRLVASGRAEVEQLVAQSSVKVEEANLSGSGFVALVVDKKVAGSVEVSLAGTRVETLEIRSQEVTLAADKNTEVKTLAVKADHVAVKTESGTTIGTLVADGKVAVTGKGTVQKAQVNVSGVSFETRPQSQEVAPGVTAPTTGTATGGSSSGGSGGSSGGGGGGSGGTSTVTATAITGADVKIKCGSIDYDYDFYAGGQPVTYASALQAPYYLDPEASTVTLVYGTNTSNAVPLASLNLDGDGRKSYSGTQEMNSDFVISGAWFPTQVVIALKSKTAVDGKSVANPWEKTFTVDIGDELDVFKINADAGGLFLLDANRNPVGNSVTGDLLLAAEGQMGSAIAWESSDPSCIQISSTPNNTPQGAFYNAAVTRGETDKAVTLRATLTLNDLSLTRDFDVTVLAKEPLVVSASDAHIPLDADGKTPQAIKNYWVLTVENANPNISVRDGVYNDDVVLAPGTSLPAGFSYRVQKVDGRNIKIYLEGGADASLTDSTEVKFVVQPTVLTQPAGFKSSGPVSVWIDPPQTGVQRITVNTADSDLFLMMDENNTGLLDDTWVLKVTSPQIKPDVSANDLTFTGLPDGLSVQSVQSVVYSPPESSIIIITVAGTANQPVKTPVNVAIVVKARAAADPGYADSDQIPAVIKPIPR